MVCHWRIMIFGVFHRKAPIAVERERDRLAKTFDPSEYDDYAVYNDETVHFLSLKKSNEYSLAGYEPQSINDGNFAAVFSGTIYNLSEILHKYALEPIPIQSQNGTGLILNIYKKYGIDFVKDLNGKFAFGIWDKLQRKFTLARDHFGVEPLYYYVDDEKVIFASSVPLIFKFGDVKKELNLNGVGKYLLFNYNPGFETIFQNVFKLPPAHLIRISKEDVQLSRFWKLSFSEVCKTEEKVMKEQLFSLLKDSVSVRMKGSAKPGIFLSGGMDSSTVLTFTKDVNRNPLKTFSYRCRGETFDESHYARFMAKHTGAEHYEIEYAPHDVLLTPEIIREMSEPFCDIGIKIATYILGREAYCKVSDVCTGDGGDELFGGHPVYEADKVSQWVDRVPGFFKNSFITLLSLLPDSGKKKNITVKLKRFSESLSLPSELLSHRWRTYYSEHQIGKLLGYLHADKISVDELHKDILRINREADGPDMLSRSLYSDYNTVVDFYLRRNDLIRKFQLQMHFPLLDFRLAEYCSLIPSRLKINGWFNTKYILKKTMESVLPPSIVYRRDKLGHSIPLKNWIRDDREVKSFFLDFLSEETVRNRGFFQYSEINRMVYEHMRKKRNHSHRLWAMVIMEMWLQEHYDK